LQLRTKSKHKATFVCLLALLPLFATQGKQASARDRRKIFYLCLLIVYKQALVASQLRPDKEGVAC
jgi:hypothetical protein